MSEIVSEFYKDILSNEPYTKMATFFILVVKDSINSSVFKITISFIDDKPFERIYNQLQTNTHTERVSTPGNNHDLMEVRKDEESFEAK